MSNKIFNLAAESATHEEVVDRATFRIRNVPHPDFFFETVKETLVDVVNAIKEAPEYHLEENLENNLESYLKMVVRRANQLSISNEETARILAYVADNCDQSETIEDLATRLAEDLDKNDNRGGPSGPQADPV